MQNEKIQINLAPGQDKAEVILREVDHANELPVKEPNRIEVLGTIGTIVEFLSKRWNASDNQINKERTHVIVDRDNLMMKLVINEDDAYKSGEVTAKIQLSRQYKDFGINTEKTWEPNELGQFFKMNRSCFLDKSENMDLVSKLKSFVADVNTKIEREQKENGSFKDNYSGVVNANIPGSFKLNIPVFKGCQSEILEVEFYAYVSGRDITLALCSPDANQVVEDVRDNIMDDQIAKIREIAPEIPILEV